MALLEHRGFREEDFARLHPGGKLGTRWLRVADLMHRGADLPLVREKTPLLQAVYVMSSRKLGIAAVVDARRRLAGVVTDGDLRRMIERGVDFSKAQAGEVMTRNPVTIDEQEYGVQALRLMESRVDHGSCRHRRRRAPERSASPARPAQGRHRVGRQLNMAPLLRHAPSVVHRPRSGATPGRLRGPSVFRQSAGGRP